MPKSDTSKASQHNDGMPQHLRSHVFRFLRPSKRLGSGGILPKTTALGRLLRWPRYVRLQRQRKILLQRLKIPPPLNLFNQGCSKEFAAKLVRFCKNYTPETRRQKNLRLRAMAKLQAEGKPLPNQKRPVIKMGLNHVTHQIERGRAKLVLIAHDVDPIELVLWMPALCVKKNVPFVIFKSKSRLGNLVHMKNACCLAICDVRPQDNMDLKSLQRKSMNLYNRRYNQYKKMWGKRVLGVKTRHKIEKNKRVRREEIERRLKALS